MTILGKIALAILRKSELTLADRTLFTGVLLDGVEGLPIRDIITNSDEGILINGKLADVDTLRVLRDSAKAALENKALDYIGQQVMWLAVQRGIINADTPEKLYFYRASIWFGEQLKQHLAVLAQTPLNELT